MRIVSTMRIVLAIILPALLFIPSAAAQEAALFDELAPLFPDTAPPSGAERHVCHTPRGVPAGVHVVAAGLPAGAPVEWRLLLGESPAAGIRAFRLIDVPVEQNTGIGSRTEIWEKKENPHVIRDAPFRIFEVLEPATDRAAARRDGLLALRLEVDVAPDAKPGTREYRLLLEAGAWRKTLKWELHVLPATVPPTGPQSPGYTNWFSPALVAERHGLERWSEPFWKMLGRYADLMARGRQNTFMIRWSDFMSRKSTGELTVETRRLERYIRLFLDRGFTRIEGGHIARRHKNDWSSPRLDLLFSGADVVSPEGRKETAVLLAAIQASLAEAGLPEGIPYLQHLTDEPTDKNAASYKALAKQVRQAMPGVKIFEATMSQALVGAVDHWCPQVQKYQQNREFFEERKKAGDEVWVYTCLVPGGPWLNRLLDQERLRQVYIGWSLVKYDLEGFLHWGLNHYRKGTDPFEKSVVPHGKGPPNFLPAGDSHVVYPGADGPLSGLRFEAHRIGMEDAELLLLLEAHDPAAARSITDRVFRAFDDYETGTEAYRAVRRQLLLALPAD